MIVMKFGGSSLESASALQRVASIVRNHLEQHPVVVVSAMGKTTDRLLSTARHAAAGNSAAVARELVQLRRFHMAEALPLVSAAQAQRTEADVSLLFDEL